jgi:tetratricopeptide (TPR) repeat protein
LPALAEDLSRHRIPAEAAAEVLGSTATVLLRNPHTRQVGTVLETFRAVCRARGLSLQEGESSDGAQVDEAARECLSAALQGFVEVYSDLGGRLIRERADASSLADEVLQQPRARRRWLIRNARRFQTFGLAEHLLERVRTLWHGDQQEAEQLTTVALEICELLDFGIYGTELIHDLRAQTLAYLANSHRVLRQLRNVEEIFQAAAFHLEKGTGDPELRAVILSLKAQLRVDQFRLKEAGDLLDQAAVIYRVTGKLADRARVAIQRYFVMKQSGCSEEALAILQETMELTREREPQFYFYAYHNMIDLLWDLGRNKEALERVRTNRKLAAASGGVIDQIKVTWLEGRILASADRKQEAEEALCSAMDQFFESHLEVDGVGVALDLMKLYLENDRPEDAHLLLSSLIPRTRKVPPNILAALVTLQQAFKDGEASPDLVREVERFVDKAESNPSARFELPAVS